VGQFQGSQGTNGIPFTLPGGDPSFIMVPPEEQWRTDYVFPDAGQVRVQFRADRDPPEVRVFSRQHARRDLCRLHARTRERMHRDATHTCPTAAYITHRCQLSFPQIDNTTNPPTVNVGVANQRCPRWSVPRRRRTNRQQGVEIIVSGFDRYVSYAYPGGTSLIPVQ